MFHPARRELGGSINNSRTLWAPTSTRSSFSFAGVVDILKNDSLPVSSAKRSEVASARTSPSPAVRKHGTNSDRSYLNILSIVCNGRRMLTNASMVTNLISRKLKRKCEGESPNGTRA